MTKEEKAAEMARRKEERKQVRVSVLLLFAFHLRVLGSWGAFFVVLEDCTIEGAEEERCWGERVVVCRPVECDPFRWKALDYRCRDTAT